MKDTRNMKEHKSTALVVLGVILIPPTLIVIAVLMQKWLEIVHNFIN